MSRSLSLYIHIPFCVSKCDYCDFYSERISHREHRVHREFLDRIILDINEQVERFQVENIPTVYIGGGTPSVLGTDIKILFDALKKMPAFAPQANHRFEFTIEANPESLTKEFLDICKDGGVTRISLGVQTMHEPSRFAVNRAGTSADAEKALNLASKYFPGALSVDLITGFPHHTKNIVINDIKKVLAYDPAHVSVYSLTLEKETQLYKKVKEGAVLLPDSDESDELWLAARDSLIKAGYKHYEVSNFAREGAECRHNIRYWRMEGWLGCGPGASGTIIDDAAKTAMRYTVNKEFNTELTELNRIELLKEVIMMGYRYCDGPDPKWGVEKQIPQTLHKWKDKNIMLYLNSFLVDAFNELDN